MNNQAGIAQRRKNCRRRNAQIFSWSCMKLNFRDMSDVKILIVILQSKFIDLNYSLTCIESRIGDKSRENLMI